MKAYRLTGMLALFCVAGPVWAADACTVLCDAKFYTTANAAEVQAQLAQGTDVNAHDQQGKSALHWAANAMPEVISALLAAGADVNAKDQWDRTPLHFVGAAGSIANVQLLLDAGADVNAQTANKWTPIHGAAKFGSPENVSFLLDAGADPTARTEMGETAYDFGSQNPKLADTDVLLALKDNQ